MKKRSIGKAVACVLVAGVLAVAALFAGCSSSEVYITDVSIGETTYTLTYSDGTQQSYLLPESAYGVDAYDLYETYLDVYELDADSYSYADFLKEYLCYNTDDSSASIAQNLLSSVVVYAEYEYSETYSSGRPGSTSTTYTMVTYQEGSGVIWEMDDDYTYIVTNYHVVYASDNDDIADTFNIFLYGSGDQDDPEVTYTTSGSVSYPSSISYGDYAIEAEYVGGSITTDIAVLKTKTSDVLAVNSAAQAVVLADEYHVGEDVYVIGNAEGYGLSVTSGIVSVANEWISLQIDSTTRVYRSIRFDAAIYSGNSGGGLFSSEGLLIGIANAGSSSDELINFAIPLNIAKGVTESILASMSDAEVMTETALGLTTEDANAKFVYDSSLKYGYTVADVTVTAVTDGSAADSLGLEEGDVITGYTLTDEDGNESEAEVLQYFDLDDMRLFLRAGCSVSLSYVRDGAAYTTDAYTVKSSDTAVLE